MSDLVRLSVNLNRETANALKKYAADEGVSMTEAIRRSIGVMDYLTSERAAGRRFITEEPDGTQRREMVLM